MAILDTPGKRMKALRADLGITQIELGRRVGTPHSHISAIEAGRVPRVSGELLGRIATALGSTTDYLLCLTGDPLAPPEIQPDDLPENYRFLYKRIESLPPALRDQAIEYLIEEIERMERLLQAGRQLGREAASAPV